MADSAYAIARPGPIVDRLGTRRLARDAVLVVTASLFTAVMAQLQVRLSFTPVPITGQTLAFLVAGASLGSWRGGLSQVLYVLMGAVGLPLFAGQGHGVATLLGPSGGYLVGGIACAFGVGLLAERGWDRRPWTALVTFAVGELLVYGPGLANLARFVGSGQLFVDGLYPFVPGDVIKMLAAAAVLPLAWRLVGEKGRR